jgi:hypothetical protein
VDLSKCFNVSQQVYKWGEMWTINWQKNVEKFVNLRAKDKLLFSHEICPGTYPPFYLELSKIKIAMCLFINAGWMLLVSSRKSQRDNSECCRQKLIISKKYIIPS